MQSMLRFFVSMVLLCASFCVQALAVRTTEGMPKEGDVYQNVVRVKSQLKIALPPGTWLVSHVYTDRQMWPGQGGNYGPERTAFVFSNRDGGLPFKLFVVRYEEKNNIRFSGAQNCERRSDTDSFAHSLHGTTTTQLNNTCSQIVGISNLRYLIKERWKENAYYGPMFSKIDASLADALPDDVFLIEAASNQFQRSRIFTHLFVDTAPLGETAQNFRSHLEEEKLSASEAGLLNWRDKFVASLNDSFFNGVDPAKDSLAWLAVPVTTSGPKLAATGSSEPVPQPNKQAAQLLEEIAANASRAKLMQAQLAQEQAAEKERVEAARLAQEKLAQSQRDKEQEKLASEVREREQQRVRTEALAKQKGQVEQEAKLAEQERLQQEARVKEQARLAQEASSLQKQRLAFEEQLKEQERVAQAQRQKEAQDLAKLMAEMTRLREQLLLAQSQPVKVVAVEDASKRARQQEPTRRALVIGNDSYQAVTKLANARADAQAMGVALQKLGFDVTTKSDLTERGMKDAIRSFKNEIRGGDEVVIFFAGHGVQLGSSNYLLPVDIRGQSEDQVKDEAIPLQRILDDLQDGRAKFSLAIIDACRDNPFVTARRAIGGRGLAATSAASGQMVIFSAGTGQQALDRLNDQDKDPNGLFTRVFLREMEKPGIPIDRVLRNVRNEVVRLSKSVGHEQVPSLYDQALGDFYFKP